MIQECRCCIKEKEIEEGRCVCSSCMNTEKGQVIAIREYLREHPEAKYHEICKELKINPSDLDYLIDKGSVTVKRKRK